PDKLDLHMLHEAQMYLTCRGRRHVFCATQSHAWGQFYDIYDRCVRLFIKAYGLRLEAEDCRQDAWLEIVNRLPSFQSDGTQRGLCSWLQKIVHSKAVDVLRYQRRHPTKRLSPAAEVTLASRDIGPVAEYEHARRQEAVQHVLAEMRQG